MDKHVREDMVFLIGSIIGPLLLWWFLIGSRRYNTKGMK